MNHVRPAFLSITPDRRKYCRSSAFPALSSSRKTLHNAAHVRIRVSQNLRQHVVLHGKAGERMPCNVRSQRLVDIADACQLFEVGVHLAVARYRQQLPALSAMRVVLVLLQEFHRVRQQGDAAHYRSLFSWFMNP